MQTDTGQRLWSLNIQITNMTTRLTVHCNDVHLHWSFAVARRLDSRYFAAML